MMGETYSSENTPLRLLIADDEAEFVDVIARRIAKRNVRVRKAYRGYEAIDILREEPFDVALLGLKMTDMDGLELLQLFKKIAPDLRIVILTDYEGEAAARDSVAHGAADYLIKPCDFDELIATIWRAALSKV